MPASPPEYRLCYVCGVTTTRIASMTRPFPAVPANPKDAVPICSPCIPSWNFALHAHAFTRSEANAATRKIRKRRDR